MVVTDKTGGSCNLHHRGGRAGRLQTSGITMGWLLRLVTGAPTGKGAPTVPDLLIIINLNVCVCCYGVKMQKNLVYHTS